jgi:molybdenum cofactor cytidylyltransferase
VLAAVILSGGASRRMGSPKALLSYHGTPFLEHLLAVTQHPAIGVRRVVLGADAEAISQQVALAPDEVVVNKDWEQGQLSSIHAALRSLPPNTDGMLLCPVDHPLVSASLVGNLIEAFLRDHPAVVVPSYRGRRGHPVVFSATTYDELLNAPMDQGARAVVWAHKGEVHEVSTTEEGCVLNLNDPNAVAKLDSKRFPEWRKPE